jgi:hypothetical protein
MQNHSFAHTVRTKIKEGRLQKGGTSTKNPQKTNITMVEPFAGSDSMSMVIKAIPPQQPLHDGLVEGTVEGFFQLCKPAKKIINFVKAFM